MAQISFNDVHTGNDSKYFNEYNSFNLADDLIAKLDKMLEHVAFIEERSPQIIDEYRRKLEDRVKELLGDANVDENRLLTEKHLFETFPEFDDELNPEELEDYLVYDSEYKKLVPVSRLMNNRKKLSEEEVSQLQRLIDQSRG